MRAAMVGGTAYYAGKKVQQGREQDAATEARLEDLEAQQAYQQQAATASPPPQPAAGGLSDSAIEQLKQLAELKTQGVLTDEEFEAQKRKILS
jgi:putative oligomerization/nucleic acid binding protein